MRLTGRVRRLERGGALATVCRVCRGEGWPAYILCIVGEPEPTPPGCDGCGKVGAVKRAFLTPDERTPRGPDGRVDPAWGP